MRKIFRTIVLLLGAMSATIVDTQAQTTGSWRILSKGSTSSTGYIVAPNICNRKFETWAALAGCLNAGGENHTSWTTNSSVARISFETNAAVVPNVAADSTDINSIPAGIKLTGDVYYWPTNTSLGGTNNRSGLMAIRLWSSSNTAINWSFNHSFLNPPSGGNMNPAKVQATYPSNCGSCETSLTLWKSGTNVAGQYLIIAYNPNEPPDPDPVENVCLVPEEDQDPTSGYPESYVQTVDVPAASDGASLRLAHANLELQNCQWAVVVRSQNEFQKLINGMYYPVNAGLAITTGELLEEGEGTTAYIPNDGVYIENTDGFLPGTVENGSPVNTALEQALSDYVGELQWQEICTQMGTISCAQSEGTIIQTIKTDQCTQKVYWHDGNRSATGECIGAYDRDWPSPNEPYDPDKAWKWEPGPTPASPKDISDEKLVAISDTTGKPVTADSKVNNGSIIYYPPSAGGGNSTNNPGAPDAVDPPTSIPSPPTMNGDGSSLYQAEYGKAGAEGKVNEMWDGFASDIADTELMEDLEKLKIVDVATTAGPICFIFPITYGEFGDVELCIAEVHINLTRTLLLIGCVFMCRKIVFGGGA